MQDIRGTAVIRKGPLPEWKGVDSSRLDQIGHIDPIPNPYMENAPCATDAAVEPENRKRLLCSHRNLPWEKPMCCCLRMKSEKLIVLYAHTSRILHHETNPGLCACAIATTWR